MEAIQPATPPLTALRRKDLLGIADLSAEEIVLILDTAEAMKEVGQRAIKKVPTLRGRTVVNLFFEPSTRTRTSFEIAEKRLSADTLNVAIGTSSVVKGETLVDTAMNIEAMAPSMIVLRHSSSGACHMLSRICRAGIINAGDGMHEHPTQALLDAYTIRERKGPARRAQGRHLWRPAPQPRAAVEHPAAHEARRGSLGLWTGDVDSARSGSAWACASRRPWTRPCAMRTSS